MSGQLQIENRAHVAWLTLVRDVIDSETIAALRSACELLSEDETARCVAITGSGAVFLNGWDWNAIAAAEGTLLEAARAQGMLSDPFGCLAGLARPVVCALNGDAHDAGLELALACDIRIAAEGARFSLPETGLGLLPMAGGTQRLARLVGRGRALEMVLSGEPIGAQEALRIGLVSAVVPAPRLAKEAERIAARIAGQGPLATRYAKEAVSRGIDMPLEQGLRYETDLTVILQTTEDRAEGVRAFLDKRKPKFKGS